MRAAPYSWVDGVSLTHMEILHAAYRPRSPNACFLLRENGFLDGITDDAQKAHFIEPSTRGKAALAALKLRLAQRFPRQTFKYTCTVEGGAGPVHTHGTVHAKRVGGWAGFRTRWLCYAHQGPTLGRPCARQSWRDRLVPHSPRAARTSRP